LIAVLFFRRKKPMKAEQVVTTIEKAEKTFKTSFLFQADEEAVNPLFEELDT